MLKRTAIALCILLLSCVVAYAQFTSPPWFIGLDGGIYRPDGKDYHRMGLATTTSLAVSGSTPYVVGLDSQIWTTTSDMGWHPIMPGVKARRIAAGPNGALFIVGTDRGVYSVGGGNLRRIGLGLAEEIAVGAGNIYVVGTDGHIWWSPGADGNWRMYNTLALAQRVAVTSEGGRDAVYILGTDHGVYRLTTDRFDRLGLGTGTELAVSSGGEPYLIGGGNMVWRYNKGQWSQYGDRPAGNITFPR
jgi:hypothetical protein